LPLSDLAHISVEVVRGVGSVCGARQAGLRGKAEGEASGSVCDTEMKAGRTVIVVAVKVAIEVAVAAATEVALVVVIACYSGSCNGSH